MKELREGIKLKFNNHKGELNFMFKYRLGIDVIEVQEHNGIYFSEFNDIFKIVLTKENIKYFNKVG